MKSKYLSVTLALVLVFTLLLTSCASVAPTSTTSSPPGEEEVVVGDTPTEKVKIVFWNGVGAPENVVLTELVEEYNKTNTDNVQVEEVITDWGTLYSKILLDFQSGEPPDIVTMQQSALYQNVEFGILRDLTDTIAQKGFSADDFVTNAWDGTFIDGKQFALPFDMHPLALYYNTKMFEDAGLDPTQPPTNMEEFLAAAEALTVDQDEDGTPEQYGFGMTYTGGLPFRFWMSLLWQHEGQDVLTEDNAAADFNNPAGLESLEFLHSLVYDLKVVPVEEQSPDDDFMKEIVGMVVSGPWSQFDFDQVDGLEYATAPLPVFYDQQAAWADSHVLALPDTKDQARIDAAMSFAEFLSSKTQIWSEKAGHLPVRLEVLNAPAFGSLTNAQAFAETLPYAHYYPSIKNESIVFGRSSDSPFVFLMESTLLNAKSAQDALNEVESIVNGLLK